jgi:hypothetical protein
LHRYSGFLLIAYVYHDHMNIISEYLWDIAHDPHWANTMKEELALLITSTKASRIMKLTQTKIGKRQILVTVTSIAKMVQGFGYEESEKKEVNSVIPTTAN